MRKVRIGNDINVRWEVKTDGQAVSLEGKALKLYVRSAYKKEEITTFTVEGCVVSFTYPASMQRMTGARAVILEDATEGAPRRTVCADQAFTLVAHSCEENDDDVEFEDFMVSLQSNVLIGKPGLSAYEVWLSEGNTGTLADWYAYLQKPATDVAAEVTKAETARVEAEKKREEAETARQDNESARQKAENGRAKAELKRTDAEQERADAELLRKNAETKREQAEEARQGDENLRKTAEENRASAETGRSDAEQRRDANETSREAAEQMRKSDEADRIRDEKEREEAETNRKAAEELRETAENQRYDAEQERRQHEDAREDTENKRDTAETLRKQAETGRDNAEQERKTSEQTRKDSETSRVAAEKERTASEQTRKENETARVAAESGRDEKETERKSAEQERKTAEQGRNTAEQGRVSAETARQSAEAKREQAAKENKTATDNAVAAADAATSAAKTATDKANTAAMEAENVNASLNDSVISVTNRKGETKTMQLASLSDVGDVVADVKHMSKTMGAYTDRADINLTAVETNKAISTDGAKVTKSGWAIAEFTAEKGNVYLFKPNVIDGSVCIFSEYIQSVETRGIDYTYTYNTDGTVASASATYLGTTHTYTYTYAKDKSCTITDETGAVVNTLPMVYETKVGTYSPLVSLNADAELPKDGYCRYMSHFKGNSAIKIAVSYKVGVADLTMKVTRDGVLASISTQLGNLSQKEDETRKKIDVLHGNWVDVLYLTDTTAYVDNKEIIIKGRTRIRLYPKTQLQFGGIQYRPTISLLWADFSHLTSAIKLSVYLYGYNQGLFNRCNKIKSVELNSLAISQNTTLSSMFNGCSSLQSIGVEGWDVSKVTNMNSMFNGCSSLQSIGVEGWDVSKVTNMNSMFNGCSSLQSIGVEGWDVSKVTNMNSMFNGCSSLQSIGVEGWDVSKVTNIEDIFFGCSSLKVLDLSGWELVSCNRINNLGLYQFNPTTLKLGTGFFKCPTTKVGLGFSSWVDASVKESLVTNSYDRKTNGLPDLTLTLSRQTKAVLSEDDIATMTTKGYIIA